jgi:hypothetical protein
LGAYRSATEVMRILREQYEQRPKLMERMWLVRGHSLSAIVSFILRIPYYLIVRLMNDTP